MPLQHRLPSTLRRLGLLVCFAFVAAGVLLWLGGDRRHTLGAVPLVLLLVCPLLHSALRARRHAPGRAP